MEYIIGLVVTLLGLFLFERNRRKSAESLYENEKELEKLDDLNKGKIKNSALLEVEQEKRKRIDGESNDKKQSLSLEDLVSFFNKFGKHK